MSATAAPFPPDETDRLATLRRLEILDTSPEQAYDDLTVLATQVCGTPIAIVALLDAEREWFKSTVGTPLAQTDRNVSFCAHAILQPDTIFTVPDTALDSRFAGNPYVTGEPHIRFYAGAPIVMVSGHAIGTLCVIDTQPRTLTDAQHVCLQALARQAAQLLDLREKAMTSERLAREYEKLSVESQLKQRRGVELLELVLRGGQMGLWDLHVPTGVWTVNAREQVMLGYAGVDTRPDLLDWRALVHPDDWRMLNDAMEPHLNGCAAFYECTHRMRHADGHYLWIVARGVIVERNVRGEALRIVGTHVDVTAQKSREEQIRNAERLELALGGGDHGLWDWHVPSGRVVLNVQWSRMYGIVRGPHAHERAEDINGLWNSVAYAEDRERARGEMDRHLCGLTPLFETEMRMRHKDGRVLWVHYRAKVVERDALGAAVRVAGTSMNITERKAGELALQRATELLERTGRMARVGGWTIDVEQGTVVWSDQVYRLHEVDPAQPPDLSRAMRFFTPDSRLLLQAAMDAAVANGTPWDLELTLVTPHGRLVWIRTLGSADLKDGKVVQLHGTVQDITERKLAENRQADSEKRLRGITDNLPALIAEIDPLGRFRFVNETYRTWLGIDPPSVLGKHVGDAVSLDYYAGRRDYLARACAGEKVSFEQTLKLPIGERCLQTAYLPHFDHAGAVSGVYALTSDITELKKTQHELDRLARFDALTGLANRRQFEEKLGEAMARTRRTGHPIAVLYIDIDRFKSVNDRHGHAIGDAVLVEFGERLKKVVRETDVVARHAGDEFVVILENIADEAEARAVATKLVAAIHPAFAAGGRSIDVTTSVGVALFNGGTDDGSALLSLADGALYHAKAHGRDRISVAIV